MDGLNGEPTPPPVAFRPPPWASGPHAQTLLARLLRRAEGPPVERERLDTPDGDFLDVDWGPDPHPTAPIVMILHGLEGSSRRGYVRSLCSELVARGIRPLAMNFRGCSGVPNRSIRSYHSGFTTDPRWLLQYVAGRHPGRRLAAIGFSLGGNVLLKMLGEDPDGGQGLLDAAAAISVPYDLAAGSALLERTSMGRLYSGYFLRSLRRKISARRAEMAGVVDVEAAQRARTIRAFDEAVTAPLNGFRDASDYYARSSSDRYLEGIRVPTLLIHAVDDPFLPADAIPFRTARDHRWLRLDATERGGHVGFLEGRPWAPRFWAEARAADFVASALRG